MSDKTAEAYADGFANGKAEIQSDCDTWKARAEQAEAFLRTANSNTEEFERKWYLETHVSERLREAIRGLMLSSDSEWYRGRGGHDWCDAYDEAVAALAASEGKEAS